MIFHFLIISVTAPPKLPTTPVPQPLDECRAPAPVVGKEMILKYQWLDAGVLPAGLDGIMYQLWVYKYLN